MKYQPVIGLEIHIQGKTKSKMFCSCDADYFGDAPNTHVCPVCLGLPGALPVPNKAGIEQAIRLGLALNCKIAEETKFDRKNYFYPDLPKAFQISQYDQPVSYDGYLEIDVHGDARRIRIRRAHLEEDTGKSIHEGANTYLDFNKSGIPLIEVVTEPDFEEIEEVLVFSRLLKQTVEYLGVSDAEMQKGQMRFELNISLRTNEPAGQLPDYRVEVKNIGSISVLEKVIEYEVARQTAEIDAGQKLKNETRGLKDMSGETVRQRVKESEDDYRYFPEPDIPPIHIDQEWLEKIRKSIGELPADRRARYMTDYGLEAQQADILVEQNEKGDWIDTFAAIVQQEENSAEMVKEAVKWLTGEIAGIVEKSDHLEFTDMPLIHEDLILLIKKMNSNQISGTITKKVIAKVLDGEGRAEGIIEKEGLEQVSDSGEIKDWAQKAIGANPKVVDGIEKNPNAYKALIGWVMRESRGQVNPQMLDDVFRELLGIEE